MVLGVCGGWVLIEIAILTVIGGASGGLDVDYQESIVGV